jgi:quercetin dioxygenase-like cupin family protein
MPTSEERLRPRPADRFAGGERTVDLEEALRALRAEPARTGSQGHRQITLVHHGPVRLVLFTFEPGGGLPEHRAPGWVTIHVLRGTLQVGTGDRQHALSAGQLLTLDPDVAHDVEAGAEGADMLLGVYPRAGAAGA